jgi:hypothetical protein
MRMKHKMIALGAVVMLGGMGILMNPSKAVGQGPPGGLAVNLVNPLPVPVRTVSELFQPVLVSGSCNGTSPASGCTADLYAVPAGKRLVIEYFSAFANLPSAGDSARVNLQISTNLRTLYLPLFPPAAPGVISGAFTSGGQAMRAYAEPFEVVSGHSLRSAGAGSFAFVYEMSGYLVNVTP